MKKDKHTKYDKIKFVSQRVARSPAYIPKNTTGLRHCHGRIENVQISPMRSNFGSTK